MNKFLIRYPKDSFTGDISNLITKDADAFKSGQHLILLDIAEQASFQYKNYDIFVFGDLISVDQNRLYRFVESANKESFLKQFKGLFYIVTFNHENAKLEVFNSIFSILPIYYLASDQILVSNKVDTILQFAESNFALNYKYLLEQYIFNYPLLNNTLFRNIKLLSSFSYISISSSGLSVKKYFEAEELINSNPIPWNRSLDQISSLYIERFKEYYPDDPFWIAFTGGFDSRTLVSVALQQNKKFETYAFGIPGNPDFSIPLQHASSLGIPFRSVYLNDPHYIDNYYSIAKETSIQSDGDLSQLYSHFLYTARELGREKRIMLTGYCGSEILRAPNRTGTVISDALKFLVSKSDPSVWIPYLQDTFRNLKYIRQEIFQSSFNELIEELVEFRKKRLFIAGISENQILYILMLEEIFRKFFGSWIKVQSPYITVRIPYLDFELVSEIFKTKLSGLNNRYYTRNPVHRYKGQLLYASIIRKTSPELFRSQTVKGYSPRDLTRNIGYISISLNYLRKRIHKRILKPNMDNLSILTGIYKNRTSFPLEDPLGLFKIQNIKYDLQYFNKQQNEKKRDQTVMAISQLTYLNHIEGSFNL